MLVDSSTSNSTDGLVPTGYERSSDSRNEFFPGTWIENIYHRSQPGKASSDRFWSAFLLEEAHLNIRRITHGGTIAAFADMVLGYALFKGTGRFGNTIDLNIKYLGSSRLGQLLEGMGEIIAIEDDCVYVRGHMESEGIQVALLSAVFKLVPVAAAK